MSAWKANLNSRNLSKSPVKSGSNDCPLLVERLFVFGRSRSIENSPDLGSQQPTVAKLVQTPELTTLP